MKYKFTVYIFAYIFITALISSCSSSKIIKTNGKIIKAIVLEVGVNSIKYKKCNDKHGRAYRIPKSSIYMIKYENGDSEVFNEKVKPEESNTSSVNQRKNNENSILFMLGLLLIIIALAVGGSLLFSGSTALPALLVLFSLGVILLLLGEIM